MKSDSSVAFLIVFILFMILVHLFVYLPHIAPIEIHYLRLRLF